MLDLSLLEIKIPKDIIQMKASALLTFKKSTGIAVTGVCECVCVHVHKQSNLNGLGRVCVLQCPHLYCCKALLLPLSEQMHMYIYSYHIFLQFFCPST